MIAAIKDVFYSASDMDRSVAFYRRLLGRDPLFTSSHWTEFRVGEATFGLHWSEGQPILRVDDRGAWAGAIVSFQVEDIDAAAETMRSWNVPIIGEIDRSPWGSQLTIRDPDGNILKLMAAPRQNLG